MFHLAHYNHHYFNGIEAQIFCLENYFSNQGSKFSYSRELDPKKINIMIEVFKDYEVLSIANWCKKYKKKIWVTLTEHMDFINGKILWHGYDVTDTSAFQLASEYMPDNIDRFSGILRLIPYIIRQFLIYCDLPMLIEN